MAAKKAAFYAVKIGNKPGVYPTWDACQQQVNGHAGAVFKKFPTLKEAQQFIGGSNVAFFDAQSKLSVGRSKGQHSDKVTKPTPNTKTRIHQQLPPGNHKKETYYAVNFPNAPPQIYRTWPECQKATSGVQNVTFKKFESYELAKRFIKQPATRELTDSEREKILSKYLAHNFNHQMTELKTQQYAHTHVIYTDGSLLNGKYGGMGIFFGENDHRNEAVPFPNCRSSYAAEVKAILIALRIIKSEIKQFEAGTLKYLAKYIISSDNQAAVSVLRDYGSTWTEDEIKTRDEGVMVFEMIKLYNEVVKYYEERTALFNGHVFEIKWIKGHAGLHGNEHADILAGEGSEKCRRMENSSR
ncbi:hypothetical protein WICPIJ_008368 [Wickerhamomyces pijperi]|uniref:Ribonuclease H n=2 Tax=Saccharomycotina TaxID=147537 RepID=A0A9P8PZ01_WICPI|nr:hypothetical protein WICPIJ_008368 [Wickerhamomyces pijperi]